MLESFKAYIKIIAVFMIFISFAEILFPENSLKKFINIFMGLLLLAVILEPLSNFKDSFNNIEKTDYSFYDESIRDFAFSEYSKSVEREVKGYVYDFCGENAYAETETDRQGKVEKITIFCSENSGEDDLVKYLSKKYGIENIVVKTNEQVEK
ncbi:hypothetical protein B5E58_02060 [Tyzzerella sp. An114]|uniref:stage III sporulation protein AF n=1 Tax=Tyzzerella sp. An114 TaxID=1965545 RepID=UPI000B44CA9E|nr:stage III sporulation protein AF [Tyzzerella sp. An114]OUQ59896.1 hypothetical protein B5E58_02060 [Tyzzerella sp. An114]